MKPLTNYQREFLLQNFFINEKYAGWKVIAEELLHSGQCIVAGSKCIWNGGIGNFIKTEDAKGAVGCILYKFDLKYFLTSEWYKSIKNEYVSQLAAKVRQVKEEHREISDL